MLFKLTMMPMNVEVWLAANEPLTNIELELGPQEMIPFGCRAGACGVCAIEVLEGLDSLGCKSHEEAAFLDLLGFPGEHFRLACQCRLTGAATIRAAGEARDASCGWVSNGQVSLTGETS